MKLTAIEIARGQILAIAVTPQPDGEYRIDLQEVMPPRLDAARAPLPNFNDERALRLTEWAALTPPKTGGPRPS